MAWIGRNFRVHLVPTFLTWSGCQPLNQRPNQPAQSHIQPGFGQLWGWGISFGSLQHFYASELSNHFCKIHVYLPGWAVGHASEGDRECIEDRLSVDTVLPCQLMWFGAKNKPGMCVSLKDQVFHAFTNIPENTKSLGKQTSSAPSCLNNSNKTPQGPLKREREPAGFMASAVTGGSVSNCRVMSGWAAQSLIGIAHLTATVIPGLALVLSWRILPLHVGWALCHIIISLCKQHSGWQGTIQQ